MIKAFIKKYENLLICILIYVLFLMILEFMFDNTCVFKILTGYSCPGCGLTRAFISFFKMDFRLAFSYHPLFLLSLPLFYCVFKSLNGNKDVKINIAIFLIVILFIIIYLIRFKTKCNFLSFDFTQGLFYKYFIK